MTVSRKPSVTLHASFAEGHFSAWLESGTETCPLDWAQFGAICAELAFTANPHAALVRRFAEYRNAARQNAREQ
jgi:hypothetical protein